MQRLGYENCKMYAYDWRRPPLEIAQELAGQIEDGSTLIGHSNGGYILRILFEYLRFDRSRVASVFICGTPMYGSYNTFAYNQEYDIYYKLVDDKPCKSIKSLMLTTKDICGIFKVYQNTLVYFIPTQCLLRLDSDKIDPIELTKARAVHMCLSRMGLMSYVLYFNIHKTSTIDQILGPADAINIDVIKQSDDFSAKRGAITYTTKTDNLIVPFSLTNSGAMLVHDTTPLAHCFIMNSRFLAHEIINSVSLGV